MESEPKTPLGYCPNCEYPMDPGRCPECGEEVSRVLLDTEPHSVRRRRVRRRGFAVLASIVLLIGGWQVYERVHWPGLCPTSWLLAMQIKEPDWVARELVYRYYTGQLTHAEVCRMFEQALVIGQPEVPQDPYPAHVPIPVAMSGSTRGLSSLGGPFRGFTNHHLVVKYLTRIDDHPPTKERFQLWTGLYVDRAEMEDRITEPLEVLTPGPHQVTMTVIVSFSLPSPTGKIDDTPVLRSWTLTRTTTILLEDQPADHYVTPVESDDLARAADAAVWVFPARRAIRLRVSAFQTQDGSGGYPLSVGGYLWARVSGQAEYTCVAGLCIPPHAQWSTTAVLDRVPGIESATRVDLRIVPDAELAVQCWGAKEYYGRVIERSNVPLKPEGPTTRGAAPED